MTKIISKASPKSKQSSCLDFSGDELDDCAIRMANKHEKWPENVAGKFFVDEQCIDCDLCRETAPSFFTRNSNGGYSYVHTQPKTEDDIALCQEAMDGCPVEAIGNDGE